MTTGVLLVDDEREMCLLMSTALARYDVDAQWCTSAAAGLELIEQHAVDCVVTDLHMAGIDGIAFTERLHEDHPDLPVIVITAFGNMETAIRAIRAGAYDFITKPLDMDALGLAVQRAIRHRALTREVTRLRELTRPPEQFGRLIGHSAAMKRLYAVLDRVADTDASLLITGETGTGKELVARAVHERGPRRGHPFIAVNCAALPEALLESEFFGHERGAFTDARSARSGIFVQADGGTVFLDEIGELPLSLQPKLLRALQERTVRPLGGTRDVPFDVRVLCATHRDLQAAVETGAFREDLLYRIDVIDVVVPPLRDRGDDILLLAQSFLDRHAARSGRGVGGLASAAAERLRGYPWPGNVRELQNCIERAVALAEHDKLVVADLPDRVRDYQGTHVIVAAETPSELVPMHEVERRYIMRVLEAVGGQRREAARILGFDRKTLYRKLCGYRIDSSD